MNDIERQIKQHSCDKDTDETLRIITINNSDYTPLFFVKSIVFDFSTQATIELTKDIKEAQRFTSAFSCMLYHYLSDISEAKYHSHYAIN
jgi:hypothetical protein